MQRFFFLLAVAAGCGSSTSSSAGVASVDDATTAYLGLDASVDTAITLGFAGFNAATNANIAPQSTRGGAAGTLTVTGTVDQGKSTNKSMHLNEAMAGFSDDGKITYATNPSALPALALNLNKIPDGTLDGTLTGTFTMDGALKGSVTLNLTFSGTLEPVAGDPTTVERKPGTTHVTGTATSGSATYNVDVTR